MWCVTNRSGVLTPDLDSVGERCGRLGLVRERGLVFWLGLEGEVELRESRSEAGSYD